MQNDLGKLHDQVIRMPIQEYMPSDTNPGEKTFKSTYDLKQSIIKNFHYVEAIAKEPFSVRLDNEIFHFDKTDEVRISANLFRSYSCLDYGCSRCCKKTRYWNIFSPKEKIVLLEKYPNEQFLGESRNIGIFTDKANKYLDFYVENKVDYYCDHLDHKGEFCRIHEMNPIHCMFPLMKFKRNKRGVTYITKEKFGRNWNMQCPVEFEPMSEAGFGGIMFMLNRLKSFVEEVGVETRIDWIVEESTRMWQSILKEKSQEKSTTGLEIFFKE